VIVFASLISTLASLPATPDNLTPAQQAIRDEYAYRMQHPHVMEGEYTPASGDEVNQLRLYAYFTAAASCDKLSDWTCKACRYEGTTGTVVGTEIHDKATNTNGYVAYNTRLNTIVVGFRGTSDSSGWGQNLKFGKSDYNELGSGVAVHTGFLENFRVARDKVRAQVAQYRQQHSDATISVTGHSLGAAIATLIAQDVARQNPTVPVKLVTFGSPRVGNDAFAKAVNRLSNLKATRFSNANDAIVHLPPKLFSYKHIDLEYWTKDSNSTTVVRCNPDEDSDCANSAAPVFGGVHGWAVGVALSPGC
jgi:hypothetical protein